MPETEAPGDLHGPHTSSAAWSSSSSQASAFSAAESPAGRTVFLSSAWKGRCKNSWALEMKTQWRKDDNAKGHRSVKDNMHIWKGEPVPAKEWGIQRPELPVLPQTEQVKVRALDRVSLHCYTACWFNAYQVACICQTPPLTGSPPCLNAFKSKSLPNRVYFSNGHLRPTGGHASPLAGMASIYRHDTKIREQDTSKCFTHSKELGTALWNLYFGVVCVCTESWWKTEFLLLRVANKV